MNKFLLGMRSFRSKKFAACRFGYAANFLTLCGQVLNPLALLQHVGADGAFDQIRGLADGVQRQNGQPRKAAEAEGQRYAADPHEAAVKQEGHHGLPAGAEGEVGGVGVGVEGHHHRRYADQLGRQMPDLVGGVVDSGEQAGDHCHQRAEHQSGGHGNHHQLPAFAADRLGRTARAQHLPHEDAYGVAHGQERHAAQIEQGAGDVHSGHHVQTAGGIALVHDCHAAGPEELVEQQGHALDGDALQQLPGDIEGAVNAHNVGICPPVQVGPAADDQQLHISGDDRGQRRALNAHLGSAEVAEDQHIVQAQIHEHSHNAANHGNSSFSGFS